MSTYPTSREDRRQVSGDLSRYRKVSIMTPEPRDAYPSTISRGNPILVERIHGRGFLRNSRLAHVENGKVFGLHVETMEIAKCIFREDSGSWLESKQGVFALVGQAISRDGDPGGEYIIAAQVSEDYMVPYVDPSLDDTEGPSLKDAVGTSAGFQLAGSSMVETLLSSSNAAGVPLRNFARTRVCTSSDPHPDGAELIDTPAPGVFCYTGRGAGMNDINGVEQDEHGNYITGKEASHVVLSGGFQVPAAKRPSTGGFPVKWNPKSPIVWRSVDTRVGNL
jgi:hypothetical protein